MKPTRSGTYVKAWWMSLLTGGLVLAATSISPDWADSGTNAIQPIGYIGAPSASGYLLTTAQEVYTIDYNSADWSGNLHSRTLTVDGRLLMTDNWGNGANFHLASQHYDTGRIIVTSSGASGVPFRWGSLSTAQQTALDPKTSAEASTSPILDYIRGQRDNEAPSRLGYRTRSAEGVLGDIIHSTPLHWNDGTDRTVFVGSNDGMLHAFSAGTQGEGGGRERFAFIPSQLISKLPQLTVSPYAHRYFVDGQLAAREYPEYTESGGTSRAEISILVGGLGGGGKGFFALDISEVPRTESEAASKVLWEISSASTGFANLGYTYGTPVLTTLPNGNAALIVGNGYNNSGNGHATLFVVNPHTGAKIAELDTLSGDISFPNGLSSPTVVDQNLDGKADYVYAGDIDGNLWKFDLSNLSSTPVKLFPTNIATQASPAQAITMAPCYKAHPLGGNMVIFVTGKIFATTDASDAATHFAYGIWDRPVAYAANDTLLTQSLAEVDYTGVVPAIRVRTASSNVPNWTPGAGHHMGWKTALPIGGERVVGDGAFVTGSVFLFLATNPAVNTAATPQGENWWMQLNALTGGDNGTVRFDLNADTYFTTADKADGVSPVGRFMGGGVRSQMTTFTTTGFDIYQSNYDKNSAPFSSSSSSSTSTTQGVAGGHFDVGVFYAAGAANSGTAEGSVTFTYAGSNTSKNVSNLVITANGETLYSGSPGDQKPKNIDDFLDGKSSANYTMVKNFGNNRTVQILAKSAGAAFNGTVTVSMTTTGANPGYTKTNLTGGADAATVGDDCAGNACKYKKYFHQYDSAFDVTGVNYLNPSSTTVEVSNGIASLTQNFKVIVSNQYLNPAVKLHIGDPGYLFNVDRGYTPLKDYMVGATLDVANLQTYRRDPATKWPGNAVTDAEKLAQPKYIGSLAINMPMDALTAKDWWGNGDVRAGLHPTNSSCVLQAAGTTDGNMYQPVIPPVNHNLSNGNGTNGYGGSTIATTATGVRHNGALVVQIISDATPNWALELSVPGRPEYGWRVKSEYFSTYVLIEYATYWQHPNNLCYGVPGWTKTPGFDDSRSPATTKAVGATDPRIGSFGVLTPGTTISTVNNDDGSTTTKTVVVTLNIDGTYTTTTTVTNYLSGRTVLTSPSGIQVDVGGAVDASGAIGGGVTTPLEVLGRVNWRELRR